MPLLVRSARPVSVVTSCPSSFLIPFSLYLSIPCFRVRTNCWLCRRHESPSAHACCRLCLALLCHLISFDDFFDPSFRQFKVIEALETCMRITVYGVFAFVPVTENPSCISSSDCIEFVSARYASSFLVSFAIPMSKHCVYSPRSIVLSSLPLLTLAECACREYPRHLLCVTACPKCQF